MFDAVAALGYFRDQSTPGRPALHSAHAQSVMSTTPDGLASTSKAVHVALLGELPVLGAEVDVCAATRA
jgi:hypothetical protein